MTADQPTRGKSKIVAGVLGVVLPGLGLHHFYLGSVTAGLIVLVSAFCCLGLGSVLGLVEGILLLVMSDEEFDAKYNARAPESLEFVFQKK